MDGVLNLRGQPLQHLARGGDQGDLFPCLKAQLDQPWAKAVAVGVVTQEAFPHQRRRQPLGRAAGQGGALTDGAKVGGAVGHGIDHP